MSDFKKYLNKYVFNTVLPGSGQKLEFKPVTTGQMKDLLTHENEKNPARIEEILDDLINECVITKGFDVKDIYIQDRFFLLVEIRKYTKGTKYQFELKCPDCGSQSLQSVDLNKLKVKKLKGKKTKTIELNDDISVEMGYATRQNQIDAYNLLNLEDFSTGKQQADLGLVLTATQIISITTPDGTDKDATLEDKVYLLENIPPEQFEKIGEIRGEFGIDFSITIKCSHCKYGHTASIPTENFFF